MGPRLTAWHGAARRDLAEGSAPDRAAAAAGDSEAPPLSRADLAGLHKWSRQMLSRLRSEKSQSSKLFTRRDQASGRFGDGGGGFGGGFGGGLSSSPGAVGDGGGGSGPSWAVPFIPAGGNPFLRAGADGADDLTGAAGGGGASAAAAAGAQQAATGMGPAAAAAPSVAAIACGRAVLVAEPLRAHRLELQLGGLAPRLAALAVLLRVALLPAMPWLGLEAADRLQAEVGEAAESVAQAAEGLVALCALLPTGAAAFGDAPAAAEPRRRAAEVEAGRDSWLYSSPELTDPSRRGPTPEEEEAELAAARGGGILSVQRLQAAIGPLLKDRKAGPRALADILEPLRVRAQSAASKRSVLETELRFAARASALHAEHVSHLMLSVGMALRECRGAKDAAAIKAYFAASSAVRELLRAADSLEVHPCEDCLKSLVDVVRAQRPCLDPLPELLLAAPAADVEGRLLGKVEELHQGFKKALSRLEAHKRRAQEGGHGAGGEGGGGVSENRGGGGAEDSEDGYSEEYEEDDGEGEGDGDGRDRGAGKQGPSGKGAAVAPPPPSKRPPLPPKPGVGGVGGRTRAAGKPPQPRPEWQE
ncbi:hypothetical protein GPECTOR_12g533 [Gonium pectorale]|uniref:Uncharacterized protein n=1 Tax=Gonium pectorale TaxID=33097 RepID=A0A150GQE5_GONPE|nr:hypothetical protein GPECTOR_12g533 [Gonium pectorale]|eukprot:KXZ51570.1 hypothetical protein GPECTOR_12g533 [Gonium pectorale]